MRGIISWPVLALLCVNLLPFANTAPAQQGEFIPTGSMTGGRAYHTATLLTNGKVLIAGGNDGSNCLATAELYDPTTGTFTPTGNMIGARASHTATLLTNGKVLIAGGNDCSNFKATAELYDPTTGTFTPTGNMIGARASHTATLVNNGTVLVAGGWLPDTVNPMNPYGIFLASAELYDPATGSFTSTGSMTTARAYHTATLVKNGTVLVAGGCRGGSGCPTTTSADLYDPATGTFTPTGSMTGARADHAAILLTNGTVLIAGGDSSGTFLATAELYDSAKGTFTSTGSMTGVRALHTATLLTNGKVLIAGGYDGTKFLATAELYDPPTGTFTPTGSMTEVRAYHTATLILLANGTVGNVLVAGGYNGGTLAGAELYEAVVVFPASLTFSNQAVGTTSASQTVTLTNNESIALTITSIPISGTNASDFAETDNCLGTVSAGASCSINVTFTPTVVGSRTASLTIVNNLAGSPVPVPLTGTGITASRIAGLSASSLTFTNQMVGSTSPTQSVTLSNTGNAALIISNLGISGANASEFAETDNCGGSVAAGGSCTVNVTFSPAATGTRTGMLNITDNATSPPSPQTVALTGTGIPSAPVVSLSSTSVVFANQSLGTASAAQTVTLRNAGTATLNIQAVALAGANPGDFAIANSSTCTNGTAVAPNSTCLILLTFIPTALGTRSAIAGITDNAADSPETISLSGMAVPTPLVSVTPSNISFAVQYVGTSGLPESVTVTNNGNAPLSITSVTASPSDFGTVNACGSTLAAGASCAVGVFFDPTASGARPGTLTISDNAPGSPQTVALSGTGQDFSLNASSPPTATVAPGQNASYQIAVASAGGFSQTVAFSCSGAPSQSTCAVSPASIALNGSAATTVAVTVTTTAHSILGYRPPNRPVNIRTILFALALFTFALLASLAQLAEDRRRWASAQAALLFICIGMLLSSCGGGSGGGVGGNPGTPVGTYTLRVTGSFNSGSTNITHGTNLILVVQ